jgi:hypothetical protein
MWAWFKDIIVSLWHLVFPRRHTGSLSTTDELLDTRRVIFVMQPIMLVAFLLTLWICQRQWAFGGVWSLACIAVGFVVGFLFGIPKVLQRDAGNMPPSSNYRQRINTNLEEISDWLTKIIVGLGLVQLSKLPKYIGAISAAFATSVQAPMERKDVFGAAVVFFFICGFILGYLVTRLYLQGALGRADRAAIPDDAAQPKPKQGETIDTPDVGEKVGETPDVQPEAEPADDEQSSESSETID